MSKFKIEHGASKVRLVLLKTSIEDSISTEIDLLCQWSENDRKYVVNELLRFALTQEEDFLKYKAGLASQTPGPNATPKPSPSATKPTSATGVRADAASSNSPSEEKRS